MNSRAHDTSVSSYSAPAKTPASASERTVHSTLFSAYDVSDRVATLAPRAPATTGLMGLWNQWSAARKSAREERELWALAKGDARVMNEINCLLARAE